MLKTNPETRTVVLDHEVLASCSSGDDIETWRRKLRSAGVLSVDLSGSGGADPTGPDPVDAIVNIQRRFFELDALAPRSGLFVQPRNEPEALPALYVARLVQILAIPMALLFIGPWGLPPGIALIFGVQLALSFFSAQGASVEARRAFLAKALHRAVQQLLGNTFVEVANGVIFENSPHRTFLQRRISDVDLALLRLADREAQLRGLRDGLLQTNRRIGRPEEDDEVQAVDRELERCAVQRVKLTELLRNLDDHLARFDAAMEQLRLLAKRRALSEQLGRILDGADADTAHRAAAAIEVDIMELEGRFRELSVELSDADAQLRAVLEVQGTLVR